MAAQAINLLTLAKGDPAGSSVPGTELEALYLTEREQRELAEPWWLLVLEGELIIDLPHGDFRILKAGDALHLEAGLALGLQPLEAVVALRKRG